MNKSLVAIILLLASALGAFAQGPPGAQGSPPPGYTDLNNDWWYKIDYVGSTTVRSWSYVNGVATPTETTTQWPVIFEVGASNSTHGYHEAFKHEEGEIWVWVKWKHGQNPAPPSVLRVVLGCNINAWTSSFAYDIALDSGIGIPVRDIGIGRQWTTPGKVLRKIRIQASGDGLFKFEQKAHITANSPWSSCDTAAPNVTVAVDPRDCEITSINGWWPKVKGGELVWSTSTFPLPQDQYAWFSAYHVTRTFTHFNDLGKPAPITYPTDLTDESEWHIGLPGYYDVLQGPGVNHENIKPVFAGGYAGGVALPSEGDTYYWIARDGLLNMSNTRSGTYSSANPGEAFGNNGTYLRHITIKETRPNEPSIAHAADRDAGKTDNVRFMWRWLSDDVTAESKRTVVLHRNAELNGQESAVWDDLRIEAGYQPTRFTCENTGGPPIAGWVTRSVQQANITDPPPLLSFINVMGPIFSGGGPLGAIIMAAAGGGPTSITFFACIEMAGALLDLTPDGVKTWTMHRGTYFENQCDSLAVSPPLLVDTDQDGIPEEVGAADFRDPIKLIGLKNALVDPYTPIHDFYWRMKHRLRHKLKYEMYDKWSDMGYKGSFMRDNRSEVEIANSFFHMEFHTSPQPIENF